MFAHCSSAGRATDKGSHLVQLNKLEIYDHTSPFLRLQGHEKYPRIGHSGKMKSLYTINY